MKILLINYEFPPLGGGAGNATYYIAKEAAKMGHQVCVITSSYKGLPKQEKIDGFAVWRVQSIRKRRDRSNPLEMLSFVIKSLCATPRLIDDFKPDLVISVMAIPSGVVAYYIKKRYHVPYIISLQGGDVPGLLPKDLWLYHFLTMPITKMVWKNAKVVIANSCGLQNLAQETGDKIGIKIGIVPNGVDIERYRPAEKRPEKIKLLFVGRFVRQKGINYLLEALKIISDDLELNKVTLELVGDGPFKKEYEDYCKKSRLTNFVVFTGWMSKENLPVKYREANIFILPSIDEGMPNVLSEAMASGLAILATDIKGNNELVQDGINGYLVPSKDSGKLAAKIRELILDKQKIEKFGIASREIIKKFSWDSSVRAYLENAG